MAEVRKKDKTEKYDIDEIASKVKKDKQPTKDVKEVKKTSKKTNKKTSKKNEKDKKSLWERFRIFCNGVVSEFKKVHWPGKKDMVRYSIATIFLIIFCALFFYLINVIFALIQLIFE